MKKATDMWSMFGGLRQESLFFKVYPELTNKVTNVRMDKVECPSCNQPKRDSWVYEKDGQEHWESVWPKCGDCEKNVVSTHVTQQMKQKHEKVIENDWYFLSGTDSAGFKNFEEHSKSVSVAKAKAVDYTKKLKAGEQMNLLVMGIPGTGKSHLSKAIARTLKHEGKSVAYITAAQLFTKIKATFNNQPARDRFNEQFKNFDLVVIDDVGLETKKISEVSWSTSEWTDLLNMREGKSTVWTTNFHELALSEVIGARTMSRMYENTMFIDIFTGEDYRKTKMRK